MSSVMARGSAQGDFAGPVGTLSKDAGLWHAYAKTLEGAEVPAYQRPHYARWISDNS